MSEARPWLTKYNVPIISTDLSAARPTAQKKVSASGGDLPDGQTLGLFRLSW